MLFNSSNWDDIVFRGRNREYGAYRLRKEYPRHIRLALMWMLGGAALVSVSPYIGRSLNEEKETIIVADSGAMFVEPEPESPKKEPELEPPLREAAPPPPDVQQFKFTPPQIVSDDQIQDSAEVIRSIDLLQQANIGSKDVKGTLGGELSFTDETGNSDNAGNSSEVIAHETEEKDPDPNIYEQYEEPKAVNLDGIKRSIQYPELMKTNGIEGKVILKLLVDKEGKVTKHIVKRTAHPSFTDACLAQVYQLTFTPAFQNKMPRKAWVTVPFDFKLQKGN